MLIDDLATLDEDRREHAAVARIAQPIKAVLRNAPELMCCYPTMEAVEVVATELARVSYHTSAARRKEAWGKIARMCYIMIGEVPNAPQA